VLSRCVQGIPVFFSPPMRISEAFVVCFFFLRPRHRNGNGLGIDPVLALCPCKPRRTCSFTCAGPRCFLPSDAESLLETWKARVRAALGMRSRLRSRFDSASSFSHTLAQIPTIFTLANGTMSMSINPTPTVEPPNK